MQWHFEEASLCGFSIPDINIPDAATVVANVADHSAALMAEEREGLERMAAKRVRTYSSGRHCAHEALSLIGQGRAPITREDRVPIWPQASVGSITHTDTYAVASAAVGLRGIGVDIEEDARVDEKLWATLFTQAEQHRLRTCDFDAATIAFSAKEAGFKATYPTGKQFIGFQEAEVYVSDDGRFRIDYIGDHAPNRIANSGQGYWRACNGHVLTLFVIA